MIEDWTEEPTATDRPFEVHFADSTPLTAEEIIRGLVAEQARWARQMAGALETMEKASKAGLAAYVLSTATAAAVVDAADDRESMFKTIQERCRKEAETAALERDERLELQRALRLVRRAAGLNGQAKSRAK